MKIIDLLNKIANGEKVPKKIKYNGDEFYRQKEKCYRNDGIGILENLLIFEDLNDEIEILEEEKKIPEKSNIDFNTKLPVSGCSENEAFMMTCISHLGKTIDSLIDYLKSKGDE